MTSALARPELSALSPSPRFPSFAEALHTGGPAPDRAGKMGLYGWLIGDWEMDAVVHADDGTAHKGRGEIHFGWVLDGRAIQDVWILPGFFFGTTLRIYDPGLDAWHILWSDPLMQYYTRQVGRHGRRRRRDPLELHGDRAGRLPLARGALARRERELAIAGRFPRPPRARLNARKRRAR